MRRDDAIPKRKPAYAGHLNGQTLAGTANYEYRDVFWPFRVAAK